MQTSNFWIVIAVASPLSACGLSHKSASPEEIAAYMEWNNCTRMAAASRIHAKGTNEKIAAEAISSCAKQEAKYLAASNTPSNSDLLAQLKKIRQSDLAEIVKDLRAGRPNR
ncbi:hypothetical protein [Labrys sp. 22185]|uniref:hypothetical protein n=1 Tax=Labrys sp. 22185 TaxID=3453888 RepID=UPI003F83DB4A